MKYIPLTIVLLGITIFLVTLLGCATNKQPEFKPLPPEKLYDLLHKENVNLARKSVTEKDYKDNDDEC